MSLSEHLPEELQSDPTFEGIEDVGTLAKKYHEAANAQPKTPEFHELLPEDLREDPSLKDFKDVGSLAKSFRETKQMQGNSLRIPGEDASDEDRQAFYQKIAESAPGVMLKPDFDNPDQSKEFYRSLGMPESPDQYALPEVEGIQMDDNRVEFLKSTAHELGIGQKQFHDFMHKVLENDVSNIQSQQEQQKQAMESLKQEWGHAFEEKSQLAEKARASFFDFIPAGEMGADTMRALSKVAEQLGTENSEFANHDSQTGNVTPDEARAKISEIMGNKQHPYWNSGDPGHAEAIRKMIELQGQANPGASSDINSMRAGSMGGG